MNFYNPYFSAYPYTTAMAGARTGLFGRLFSGINFSSILSGTQKTLNIVNQTIPLVKQAAPIMKNAKTMFRVMNEFKKVDTPTTNIVNKKSTENEKSIIKENTSDYTSTTNGPTFFA